MNTAPEVEGVDSTVGITNRVAMSGIITLELEEMYTPGVRIGIDLQEWLFEGVILREKDFRAKVVAHDWTQYDGCLVYIYCSEQDVIIQNWAYMLLASRLHGHASYVWIGSLAEMEVALFADKIAKLDKELYRGAKVVVKGCSDIDIPAAAYGLITQRLMPVVQSIMYGEACSAVPVYKAKRPTE
jgi:hypothetical protein